MIFLIGVLTAGAMFIMWLGEKIIERQMVFDVFAKDFTQEFHFAFVLARDFGSSFVFGFGIEAAQEQNQFEHLDFEIRQADVFREPVQFRKDMAHMFARREF